MRRRLVSRVLLFSLATLAIAGCSKTDTPTTPTQPTPTPVNETFTGTLTLNGALTFPFVSSQAGLLTGTMTAVGPDATSVVGLAVGTFTGATCQIVLANDIAGLNSVITGQVNASGTLCARVYDVGKISAPVTFAILISHF
ncbi:MAG: hypothetical protein ABI051_06345 [Vicinamibacterales bacterium]